MIRFIEKLINRRAVRGVLLVSGNTADLNPQRFVQGFAFSLTFLGSWSGIPRVFALSQLCVEMSYGIIEGNPGPDLGIIK